MAWRFAIGNALRRAAASPVASLASVSDTLFPLSALGNGYTDEPARWARNAAGLYAADCDLNFLAATSPRADAPTGWFDFLNLVGGTPGLPANPPDWNTYAARTALRSFRPVAQDVDVMPGEALTVKAGLYLPGTSTATAVRLRVVDLWTGRSYDGSANAWDDADVYVAEQATLNTWLDFSEPIPADVQRRERTTYRILIEQDAPAFDATSYVYASPIALFPDVSFAAIVGHNIPKDALVTVREVGGGGTALTLLPDVPSFFDTETAQQFQSWRLRVEMPAGTASFHQRPYVGELWLGSLVDMTWCPAFPFDLDVEDPGQVRVAGGYGREYVFSDAARELSSMKLQFKTNGDAGYYQIRNWLEGATRHGVDPMIVCPVDTLEGNVLYHGRLGNAVAYSRKNNLRREFALTFDETPFPRVAA
jgi:hypothetical protein